MNKLKIEKGASKLRRAPLKVTVDGTVEDDLELMSEWSENDLSYLVNHLLKFAIAQSEDFQKHKTERGTTSSPARTETKSHTHPERRPMFAQPEKGATV